MTVRCQWLILCERVYLDENGNHCLTGIFEQSRPAPGDMIVDLAGRSAVAFVRGDSGGQRANLSLDVYRASGQLLVKMPTGVLTLNPESGTGYSTWTLQRFPLEVGSYEFRLLDGNTVIATAPLEIFAPTSTAPA